MVLNIYFFLSLVFLLTLFFGKFLQKIRIPWIFASLLLGAGLAIYNPFEYITDSNIFYFLSSLGMYFLLFIIGFEINLKKINSKRTFILKGSFFIIFLEAVFGGLLIHYIFNYSWLVSFIVALSFSTVGEAILIPILDEFNLINTRLGQTILGIGTLDDVIEVFILIFVILFIGSGFYGHLNIWLIVLSLFSLFALTFGLTTLKKHSENFKFSKIEPLFLFIIAVLFLFLGIGEYAEATALGSILAGVGIRTFIPDERLKLVEKEIRSFCYGFFAPIFFLWAGISMDVAYIKSYPLLILLVVLISSGSKYLGSFLLGFKEMGLKQSFLLGTGLSVRFSTSIVIVKILFENSVIDNDLYSIIIASSMVFTFVVPIAFSQLLKIYKLEIK